MELRHMQLCGVSTMPATYFDPMKHEDRQGRHIWHNTNTMTQQNIR